jgi:hypothetical protein
VANGKILKFGPLTRPAAGMVGAIGEPRTSNTGLVLAVLLLGAIGAVAFVRRQAVRR